MKIAALELDTILNKTFPQLNQLSEERVSIKPEPGKWSKKELIGHLIDSAQNNIRRFITAQYEDSPRIVYKQDDWVMINRYQLYEWNELIQLWYFQNRQIVYILQNLPQDAGNRICQTEAIHTIEWLASDYIRHLQHHLHQVLELEPVPYP